MRRIKEGLSSPGFGGIRAIRRVCEPPETVGIVLSYRAIGISTPEPAGSPALRRLRTQ